MHIVIPMSGYGERFRRAGFALPKPLIEVEGKPIIAHVIDLFPGETDFSFICNREHLEDTSFRMEETLLTYAPAGKVIPIEPHRLGPVHAVSTIFDRIGDDEEIVVNYCDFTCYWDYDDFKRFLRETVCDGCVPCYRGFHPHLLGTTNYAFARHAGLWMTDIREKEPFTSNRMEEFASSGTYYFRRGCDLKRYFRKCIEDDSRVNGEYYVSVAYKPMIGEGKRVAIYERGIL